MGMIIWFTGNSGAGKTTIAKYIQSYRNNIIVLDGDEMRESINNDLGFSKDDRFKNNIRIARLAKVLESQGYDILVSVIAPYEELRNLIKKITGCYFVYVKRDIQLDPTLYPYEAPSKPDVVLIPAVDTLEDER